MNRVPIFLDEINNYELSEAHDSRGFFERDISVDSDNESPTPKNNYSTRGSKKLADQLDFEEEAKSKYDDDDYSVDSGIYTRSSDLCHKEKKSFENIDLIIFEDVKKVPISYSPHHKNPDDMNDYINVKECKSSFTEKNLITFSKSEELRLTAGKSESKANPLSQVMGLNTPSSPNDDKEASHIPLVSTIPIQLTHDGIRQSWIQNIFSLNPPPLNSNSTSTTNSNSNSVSTQKNVRPVSVPSSTLPISCPFRPHSVPIIVPGPFLPPVPVPDQGLACHTDSTLITSQFSDPTVDTTQPIATESQIVPLTSCSSLSITPSYSSNSIFISDSVSYHQPPPLSINSTQSTSTLLQMNNNNNGNSNNTSSQSQSGNNYGGGSYGGSFFGGGVTGYSDPYLAQGGQNQNRRDRDDISLASQDENASISTYGLA